MMLKRVWALFLLVALLLCGCGKSPEMVENTEATVPDVTEAAKETVEVTTENETFEDGTKAETVTTVEKLLSSDRTTVQVTTTCIDGTILMDTIITEVFHDGGNYAETRNEVRYPEGGGSVTLEIQGTYADKTFEQVEEYITLNPDGGSYSERMEVTVDAEGNTTVRMINTDVDAQGNETKEETVSVTDAKGNPVE